MVGMRHEALCLLLLKNEEIQGTIVRCGINGHYGALRQSPFGQRILIYSKFCT